MSTAENSVRADLEAAMAQHAEPEVEKTVVEPIETKPEVTETTQERARDEKGRFAASQDAASTRSKPGDAANGIAGKGEADAQLQQPAVPNESAQNGKPAADAASSNATAPLSLAPPNGWSVEAKAKWHELPAEIMAAVQKREQDVAKFTSTRDEHASFGKDIYQAVQPYLATIRAEGGTPKAAIESLLNTAYVLRTGSPELKKQLLLQTARQFGVDLGSQPTQQTAQNTPPELAALRQELAELKGQLGQRDRLANEQLQTEVQTEIQAFAADPNNEHYHEVKGHMAALISGGLAKDLKDAYDQSVWARPDLRATLQAQQRAREEQKRRDEAKQKAEAAKRKTVSITGGPGNTAASAAPGSRGSVREDLLAAMDAHSGAV